MATPPGEGTTILVPTFNERENVRRLVPEIFAVLPAARVQVVDDGSPDGTQEAVRELLPAHPGLGLLARRRKEGLGAAYLDAMRRLLEGPDPPERIVTMDADGSHSASHLPALVAAAEEVDLVVGSRYVPDGSIEDWEAWRRLLSRAGNLYAGLATGLGIRDLTSGFLVIRSARLRSLDLSRIESAGYAYLIDLKFQLVRRARASYREVPIRFLVRRGGESKLSGPVVWEAALTPLRLLRQRLTIG